MWKEQPLSFFRVDATGLNRPGKFLISLHSSLQPETLFCLVLMMTMMMIISIKSVLKLLLLFLFEIVVVNIASPVRPYHIPVASLKMARALPLWSLHL